MSASAYPSAPLNYPDIPHPTYPYPPHPTGQTSVEHSLYSNDEGHDAHSALPAQLPRHVAGAVDGPEARTRLRKACDSCSHRKVKCDEQGPPCRACVALDIPCTFQRPTKRRGPPNKYAEKVKMRKTESPGGSGLSAPGSPTHAAHTLASLAQSQGLTAEAICPRPLLLRLIDDYFTYIHPSIPAPHEPTFRASLRDQEDLRDPLFLALLASMIGFLVASFPRRPRQHLRALIMENLYPDSMSLVAQCHQVALTARGPGYLDKEMKVYDALISYLLGLTCAYTFRWPQFNLYIGECLTISRALGLHKPSWPRKRSGVENNPDGVEAEGPINYIDQEMGRRLFWVMVAGERSLHQSGVSLGELCIPPSTKRDPYPPFPSEVDDEYIHEDGILPQSNETISQLVGFNAILKVCASYNSLSALDLSYGLDDALPGVFDWELMKRVLQFCLRKAKSALNGLPSELDVFLDSPTGGFDLTPDQSKPDYESSATHLSGPYDPAAYLELENTEAAVRRRRKFQREIQKANIYANQLSTRNYFVERYFSLLQSHFPNSAAPARLPYQAASHQNTQDNNSRFDAPGQQLSVDNVDNEMNTERNQIVKELFAALSIIGPLHLEPNSGSFVNKIWQIAYRFMSNGGCHLEHHAKMYLDRFLHLTATLDRNRDAILTGSKEDDAAELRAAEFSAWVDFCAARETFTKNGGVTGI